MLTATRRARMLPDLLTAELLKQSASNLSDRRRTANSAHLPYNRPDGEQNISHKATSMAGKMKIPQYCKHKTKGLAYVRLNGEFIYLGLYGSPESKAAYQRVVAEWLHRGRTPVTGKTSLQGLSINEVLLAFWRHAETYYVDQNGTPSRELENVLTGIKLLKDLYGTTSAAEFGPVALKVVRQKMIGNDLCRNVINQRIGLIKRVFKWAVSEELIPSSVFHGLQAVAGLRQGRSPARETQKVGPVPDCFVESVLEFLPPTLQAMVKLQRLSGMRSGELCIIRTGDIEMGKGVWIYRPSKHKTQHHGHDKQVHLGPKAQEILRPFLRTNLGELLFTPAHAQEERNQIKRAARKTKVQPFQRDRKKANPKTHPGQQFTTTSYYQAVQYAIKQAKKMGKLAQDVHWHPHQIRHTFGTEIRKMHGLDAARALMGHRSLSQAEEYAELDTGLAVKVAAAVG